MYRSKDTLPTGCKEKQKALCRISTLTLLVTRHGLYACNNATSSTDPIRVQNPSNNISLELVSRSCFRQNVTPWDAVSIIFTGPKDFHSLVRFLTDSVKETSLGNLVRFTQMRRFTLLETTEAMKTTIRIITIQCHGHFGAFVANETSL